MIDRLADAGIPVDRSCRVLGVARQNYYKAKRKPTTPTELRRRWLTGVIREVHVASRGTYGYRRVHAELTLGMDITVCERTVWSLMNQAGLYGLPGPLRVKRLRGVVTADDLVNRKFHRIRPNELWVTDITQHRTREGWLYCAAVLDAFSRRIVGWSIDSRQDSTLVVNALDMAIRNRRPEPGEALPTGELRSVVPGFCSARAGDICAFGDGSCVPDCLVGVDGLESLEVASSVAEDAEPFDAPARPKGVDGARRRKPLLTPNGVLRSVTEFAQPSLATCDSGLGQGPRSCFDEVFTFSQGDVHFIGHRSTGGGQKTSDQVGHGLDAWAPCTGVAESVHQDGADILGGTE